MNKNVRFILDEADEFETKKKNFYLTVKNLITDCRLDSNNKIHSFNSIPGLKSKGLRPEWM